MEGVFAFESAVTGLSDRLVILDLTDVPYMDSCALGSLMNLHRPSELNQRYAVVGASERLRTMFHVARVDKILVTYPSMAGMRRRVGCIAPFPLPFYRLRATIIS